MVLKQYDQIKNSGVSFKRSWGVTLVRSSGVSFMRSSGVYLDGISILQNLKVILKNIFNILNSMIIF